MQSARPPATGYRSWIASRDSLEKGREPTGAGLQISSIISCEPRGLNTRGGIRNHVPYVATTGNAVLAAVLLVAVSWMPMTVTAIPPVAKDSFPTGDAKDRAVATLPIRSLTRTICELGLFEPFDTTLRIPQSNHVRPTGARPLERIQLVLG
jgi:hypothetical protein